MVLAKYLCRWGIIKHNMVIEARGLQERWLICDRCDGNEICISGGTHGRR